MKSVGDLSVSDNEQKSLALVAELNQVQLLSGRKKYQYLIESQHGSALVQSLPPQELFMLIKEMGVVDVTDLIGLASAEQITLCVDMDCWRGDELDSDESFQWLQLLLIQDEEAFLRLIDGIDFEMLVMMVKKQLTIISGLESLADDEDLMATRKRFDQVYDCEYRNSDVEKLMSSFQDVLFRERQELFLRIMEAVRHEFDLALQEDVFTARSGRLEDLGFADPFESRSLYTYIQPDTFNAKHYRKPAMAQVFADDAAKTSPMFMLTMAQPQDILGELLSNGASSELCYDLSLLLNRALSAEKVDFGDVTEVTDVLQNVYHTLNIALGYQAGADLDQAEELLNDVYLQALYQLGFSLTVQLRRRAEAIKQSAIGCYLDGPDAALVNALCLPIPQFYNGLVDASRADSRSFHSWAEVVQVQQELECVEALQQLFSSDGLVELPPPEELDLSGCVPDQAEEVTLSELFLTAMANQLLGREFLPIPIAAAELLVLHAKFNTDATDVITIAELRSQTGAWIGEHVGGCSTFADFCIDIFDQEFISLAKDDVVAEYVGGLLIRL